MASAPTPSPALDPNPQPFAGLVDAQGNVIPTDRIVLTPEPRTFLHALGASSPTLNDDGDSGEADAARAEALSCMAFFPQELQLPGYQLYIHAEWVARRSQPVKTVVNSTRNPAHSVTVYAFCFRSTDMQTYPLGIRRLFEAFERSDLAPRETPYGTIMVCSGLSQYSPTQLVAVPSGNLEHAMGALQLNLNLRRLGCGDRLALNLHAPSQAVADRFCQLFRVRKPPPAPLALLVRRLVVLVQLSLYWLGLLPLDTADGFLCDLTVAALVTFYNQYGPFDFEVDPQSPTCDPALLITACATVYVLKGKLLSLGQHATRDPFVDVPGFAKQLRAFQKHHDLPQTSRLDEATVARVNLLFQRQAPASAVQALRSRLGGMKSRLMGASMHLSESSYLRKRPGAAPPGAPGATGATGDAPAITAEHLLKTQWELTLLLDQIDFEKTRVDQKRRGAFKRKESATAEGLGATSGAGGATATVASTFGSPVSPAVALSPLQAAAQSPATALGNSPAGSAPTAVAVAAAITAMGPLIPSVALATEPNAPASSGVTSPTGSLASGPGHATTANPAAGGAALDALFLHRGPAGSVYPMSPRPETPTTGGFALPPGIMLASAPPAAAARASTLAKTTGGAAVANAAVAARARRAAPERPPPVAEAPSPEVSEMADAAQPVSDMSDVSSSDSALAADDDDPGIDLTALDAYDPLAETFSTVPRAAASSATWQRPRGSVSGASRRAPLPNSMPPLPPPADPRTLATHELRVPASSVLRPAVLADHHDFVANLQHIRRRLPEQLPSLLMEQCLADMEAQTDAILEQAHRRLQHADETARSIREWQRQAALRVVSLEMGTSKVSYSLDVLKEKLHEHDEATLNFESKLSTIDAGP